jgi:hypothetical protein
VDANQKDIVKALRRVGVSVAITSALGDGYPDLTCGAHAFAAGASRRRNVLLEVKLPGERLTEDQARFHAEWNGEIYTVHSVDEALAVFGVM